MPLVKCLIQKYDPAVKEAPFSFITLGECEIEDRKDSEQAIAYRMSAAVGAMGYSFKFYSMTQAKGYAYDITVAGDLDDII